MKKRLPGILERWKKDHNPLPGVKNWDGTELSYTITIRTGRRTSPTTAKITFLMEYNSVAAPALTEWAGIVSIYLSYFDGVWTSTGMEAAWNNGTGEAYANGLVRRYLLPTIDEMEEK